jgi:hypothetical protein
VESRRSPISISERALARGATRRPRSPAVLPAGAVVYHQMP